MLKLDKPRILFVEDEPLALELLDNALSSRGFTMHSFSCPLKAIEWFEAHSSDVDLLITDQSMPNFTGSQLIERARTIKEKLPAIIVTGLGKLSGPYFKSGPTLVLEKPFKRQQLVDAIEALV